MPCIHAGLCKIQLLELARRLRDASREHPPTVRLGDPGPRGHFGTQNSCVSMSIKILVPLRYNRHLSL